MILIWCVYKILCFPIVDHSDIAIIAKWHKTNKNTRYNTSRISVSQFLSVKSYVAYRIN